MQSKPLFEQLLTAASAQPDPRPLLFVFADAARLPTQSEHAQDNVLRGALKPVMALEKPLDELSSFDALVQESRELQSDWNVVFAAGVSRRNGKSPNPADVTKTLRAMVERVREGAVAGLMAFSTTGEPLSLVANA